MSELLDTSDAVAWAAYFAGILDGEGYIGVQRTKGHLAPRISVRMCDHEVVVALHERYGGCLCHATSWESHWRDSAYWIVQGRQVCTPLRDALPYLRLKGEQARLALSVGVVIRPRGTQQRLTDEERARREDVYVRIRALNKRGR
jgi:hypothetical protein